VGHVVRGLGAIARAGSEIRAQPSQAGCHELSMIAAADSIDSISAGLCLPNTRGMASYCDRSTRAPSTPRVFRRASIPQPPRVAGAIFATNVVRTTTYAKSRQSEQFFAAANIFRHRGKSKSGNDLRRAPRGLDSPPQSTTAWCRVGIPTCPPLAGAFPPVPPV
jgi:hypothetical protein